jgi:hypothetical protein
MKITRSHLRRLIEGVLNEMPARQPGGLDPSFYWTVQRYTTSEFEEEWDDFEEEFRQRQFVEVVNIAGRMILPGLGETDIANLQMKKFVDCPHWEIKNAAVMGDRFYKYYKINQPETAKDLGPMMYDIAMETAGESGIISDSTSSSEDAQRIWNFYLKNRAGVDIDVVDLAPGTCGRPGKFPATTFQFKAYRKKPGSPSIIQSLGNKIRIA